jgi:glutaminase
MTDVSYVSTGTLEGPEVVKALVAEAHERFRLNDDGANSRVYPVLERVDPGLFGVCVAATNGEVYGVGDVDAGFALMSVAKPFVFALVCERTRVAEAREHIGVNATGLPFNSVAAVEESPDGRTNPMVSAGAIATTSLIPGRTVAERWQHLRDGLSRFAGRELALDEEVFESASQTNHRNREIARVLAGFDRIEGGTDDAVDLYTRQSCLRVTARDLAVMGATLADGGANPVTRERVVGGETCRCTLAVMTTAGLYETSGDWLYEIGLPGKSGIGGGIVTVAPGKGGLGTYAPPLDAAGNSVRGQLAARFLSRRLGLDIFLSEPAP